MRSPLRPPPRTIERWITALRALRWLDAFAAWLVIWGALTITVSTAQLGALAVLAAVIVALGVLIRPLRTRWRPVTGAVALVMSGSLAPGDRAWYVSPGHAERVLVTARHWTRIVIVRLGDEGSEGLSVRRTRVLLVPADSV